MSRIGKKAVPLPQGVTATIKDRDVKVKGPKGELSLRVLEGIDVKLEKDGISVMPQEMTDEMRARWGMQRTLVNNLVEGVSKGFTQTLEINGVGFRAAVQGKNLQLQLGFSHDVVYPIPVGIDIKCEKPTIIVVSGADKQKVGQVSAEIRGFRKPEPYKGKGIKYSEEKIRRKEGKKK
jgi:large subunit ribosomal protein L6